MVNRVVHKPGKRKSAIARVTVKKGKGRIRINSKVLETWEPEVARMRIEETLLLASSYVDLGKIDVVVKVKGGGVMGQADAIANSIARALVEFSKSDELLSEFLKHDRSLIAGDHRMTETHKPSQSSKGPRHKRQKSYR